MLLAIALFVAVASQPASQPSTQRSDLTPVDDRLLVLVTDDVTQHMLRAVQHLRNKENAEAADEARIVADYFDALSRSTTSPPLRQEFEVRQKQFATLARVLTNPKTAPDTLNEPISRAHHALARFHARRMMRFAAEQRTIDTAREMQAAARHLEQSQVFSSEKVTRQSRMAIERAQLAAKAMINGEVLLANEMPIIESLATLITPLTLPTTRP